MSSYKTIDKIYQRLLRPFEFHLYRLALRFVIRLGLLRNYQPLPWLNIDVGDRGQGCMLRWQAINNLMSQEFRSAIDVGCNIGFFTFRLAENNITCIGIESDSLSYNIASKVKKICNFNNVAFLNQTLEPSNIASLPSVDVVLCLSVFHHFVRYYGFSAAKGLIFETGQINETYMGWSRLLPDMGEDIEKWLETFLLDIGAKRAENIGLFPTHLGNIPRYLFVAYK